MGMMGFDHLQRCQYANTSIDCSVNITVLMYTENFLWRVQRQLGRSQSIEPDAAADDAGAGADA